MSVRPRGRSLDPDASQHAVPMTSPTSGNVGTRGDVLISPTSPRRLQGRPAGSANGITLLFGHTVSTGVGTLDDLERTPAGKVAKVSGVEYRTERVMVISRAGWRVRTAALRPGRAAEARDRQLRGLRPRDPYVRRQRRRREAPLSLDSPIFAFWAPRNPSRGPSASHRVGLEPRSRFAGQRSSAGDTDLLTDVASPRVRRLIWTVSATSAVVGGLPSRRRRHDRVRLP